MELTGCECLQVGDWRAEVLESEEKNSKRARASAGKCNQSGASNADNYYASKTEGLVMHDVGEDDD